MTVFIANIHNIQVTNNNISETCENRECNYAAETMDYAIPSVPFETFKRINEAFSSLASQVRLDAVAVVS